MNLWRDVRYSARMLGSSPGFAITAVLTMALGIGATTAIFSLCDAMLWKPVPLPHLDRLVMVAESVAGDLQDWNAATPADLKDIESQSHTIDHPATWQREEANLSGTGEPERVGQTLVSANFFDVAGVQPAIGRGLRPGEDQRGDDREVILSDGLWRRRFAGASSAIGQSIRIDDRNFTIIGIMPRGFDFPIGTDVWTPLALAAAERNSRKAEILQAIGRLKAGRSVQEAAAEIQGIGARLAKAYPDTNEKRYFIVWPAARLVIDYITERYLLMLLWAVILVLLIACANVANLQFARATGRLREVAVRRALGAGRATVIAQLVTESVLLSLMGAALGLLVAKAGLNAMQAGMPAEVRRYVLGFNDMSLDYRTLLFTGIAAVLSGIVAGVAPAWQCSHPNLSAALKEGGRSTSVGKGRQHVRNALVAIEVALALVLLVGAGLMVRGFRTLVKTGESMEPATLLTFRLSITEQKYREEYQVSDYYRQVIDRVKVLPGVRSVVAVSALPYGNHSSTRFFTVKGRQVEPGNQPWAMYQVTTPGFFETLHLPLRAGRLLNERDGSHAAPAAVISEGMAERLWTNESPIGRQIKMGTQDANGPWLTVVGVVGDVTHNPYDRVPRWSVYVPSEQSPTRAMDVAVRTAGDPLSVAPAVMAAVRSIDRDEPIADVRTMTKSIHDSALGLNYVAALMGVFGGIALLLAAVGVYGVMAYLVSEQTQEIGVRVALGAPARSVLQMIFRRGMLTVGLGMAVGLPVAFMFAHLMASLVYGVKATDPATFIGIPIALAATAALAIYVPAQRAMKIEPTLALRYE